MFKDDFEDELVVFYRRFAPAILICACLFIVGMPAWLTLVATLSFAISGWLLIAIKLRMWVAYLVVILTLAWVIFPTDLRRLVGLE